MGRPQPLDRHLNLINCETKVIQVDESTTVANGKILQNVLIPNRTATVRVTLWEDNINKLVNKKSYQLMVKEFRGEMQLSIPLKVVQRLWKLMTLMRLQEMRSN